VDWDEFIPSGPPAAYGSDTLITLDRIAD
jgi:hypothetical protein